jgi:hypothetical protein
MTEPECSDWPGSCIADLEGSRKPSGLSPASAVQTAVDAYLDGVDWLAIKEPCDIVICARPESLDEQAVERRPEGEDTGECAPCSHFIQIQGPRRGGGAHGRRQASSGSTGV